jgi:hypothetical protein
VQDDVNDSGLLTFGFNHEIISRGVLDFYRLIGGIAIAEATFWRFHEMPHGDLWTTMVSCFVCEMKSRSSARELTWSSWSFVRFGGAVLACDGLRLDQAFSVITGFGSKRISLLEVNSKTGK